jgi:hypothetical protein
LPPPDSVDPPSPDPASTDLERGELGFGGTGDRDGKSSIMKGSMALGLTPGECNSSPLELDTTGVAVKLCWFSGYRDSVVWKY